MNSASLPLTIREVDRDAPAPSPFLPGTHVQWAWDSTMLEAFKRCPRLYYYEYICGWRSRDENVHLRFGGEFHTALEDYDRLRAESVTHHEALRAIVGDLAVRTRGWDVDPETKAGRYKNRNTLFSLVIDYLDHYFRDVAETYILEDGRPAVELSFRFELDWGPNHEVVLDLDSERNGQPYLLCGHLDRIVTFGSELYVMDRKTTTSTPGSYFFDNFEPNNQMTLYTLASQVIIGSPVRGVIIDACQIKLEEANAFTRGFTYRTPDQLDEWVTDLRSHLADAERCATEGYWPQRDTSCGMYGGCKFREVCAKSPHVREVYLKSKFVQLTEDEKWNPLKPR